MTERDHAGVSDELVITPEQDARLVEAIAIGKAQQAAIRAGLPPSELNSLTWHVEIHEGPTPNAPLTKDEWIEQCLATAPPLTDEQRDDLSAYLATVRRGSAKRARSAGGSQ